MHDAISKKNLSTPLGNCGYNPELNAFGVRLEKCSPLVQKAVVRLLTSFRSDITIEMIAEELKVHPSHLEREMRKYCRPITLRQLLIGFRLQCAVFLMADEKLRLNVIGEKSGFSSARDFYRSFRCHLGMTAKEYGRRYSFADFKLVYFRDRKNYCIENFVQGNATDARKWH